MRPALLGFLLICGLSRMNAQGCSQCRDTVAQSDPSQQAGYREAIAILLAGAVGVGGTAFVVLRKFGRP